MKRNIALLFLVLFSFSVKAQIKTTGTVALGASEATAKIDLDKASSKVILTLEGPSNKWFGIQYGDFISGMVQGHNLVYWNGNNLVEADFAEVKGKFVSDDKNNWTEVSKSSNNGIVTLTYTRDFISDDDTDYVFDYEDANIDFGGTVGDIDNIFELNEENVINWDLKLNIPFTSVLGTDDFTLNQTKVYPTPAIDFIKVKTTTSLDKINIYSETGALIRTMVVNSLDPTEVEVKDLSSGTYLLELVSASDSSLKKVVVQ
jgi:hypothetical protein